MRSTLRILTATGFLALTAPAGAGELAIVGTGDAIDLMRALGTRAHEAAPDLDVVVPASIGSDGGIAAVGAGKSALARVARRLTEGEVARGLVYTPIARLPSAFFVHPGTGVTALTADQVAAIYAGRVANWKEVGGADLRIRVVRREDADSTLRILRASMPGWRDLALTERSKTAVSTQEAVETVRSVEGAIGFGPYSRSLEVGTQVLAVDGRRPTDPGYPSAGELALVHMEGQLSPDAARFIAFAREPAAGEVIRSFGAVPAPR
ncbi:PstS family phosphate ABC transporter substrate-binding protein [Methylobacterium sp. JK268]